ncbi:uncharacterized protein MONOS_17602 [Monocercomonoides exilis]|uniref:uncharacterized protein n=1 Tax=Monocercomonoides exilis TaxID=2049356 RepID=UPI00355A217B|nr:hypothetical protein MONOS_17602 [Monocercomonoides exilis]
MHSADSLNVHLNCFPLPQRRIPLCFSTSYGFRAPAVLNSVNEANGHRMRNGSGRGKELQGTLRSSARFMTPPRSKERGVRDQMKEAKRAEYNGKMNAVQNKGRRREKSKAKMQTNEKDSILLNCAAYVASQGIQVGGEEEKKKEKKKDEKRNAYKFVSYKDEKGLLYLTDKCVDNEKNEEEEEKDGFGRDIRKVQKDRGSKEKIE